MIGRENEQSKLQKAMDRNRAQIVVVYGRRRVGKTFLVNEFFSNTYAFKHTAVAPEKNISKKGLMGIQLREFHYSLRQYGLSSEVPCPKSWSEAFHLLQELLDSKSNGSKQVIFIDELPWMDTPRSGFLASFEHFCNDWCLSRKHVKLVVCGSATSWIVDEMLESKGGLYDRVTTPIYVRPFSLGECRDYFKSEGFHMDEYDVILAYMAFGGIPFYLSQFDNDLSIAQNIDAILFEKDAILSGEFDKLFKSQFENPELMKSIVVALGNKRSGLTRDEILKAIKSSSGGTFTNALSALEKSRLISSYKPFGDDVTRFRLSDSFCCFYLHHVKGNEGNSGYWQNNFNSPAMNSWLGLAFEQVVFCHTKQIKQALGISGVVTSEYSLVVESEDGGKSQIDMIIDRDDRVMNMCEIKFSRDEFAVTAEYARTIQSRIENVYGYKANKRSVVSVLITTYGLKRNNYSDRFQKVITIKDLFA